MLLFSRGLVGFANRSFSSGILYTGQAASGRPCQMAGFCVLSALRRPTRQPAQLPGLRFFSISPYSHIKVIARHKAKHPNTLSTSTTAPRPSPSRRRETLSKANGKVSRSKQSVATPTRANPLSAVSVARSFADQLGRRTVSTLLYEAPSHFWFRFVSLNIAAFCIVYAITNYWTVYLHPPEGILWWVPYSFFGVCLIMMAIAGYLLRGNVAIIRTIHAIPSSRITVLEGKRAADSAAQAVKNAGLAAPPPVFLKLEVARLVPLFPKKKAYILPSDLELPSSLAQALRHETGGTSVGTVPLTASQQIQAQLAEKERMKKEREYDMNHLMTAPFRHLGKGAGVVWGAIRRALAQDGFVKVKRVGVKRRMMLDVTAGGWALENGRSIDRLVTVLDR